MRRTLSRISALIAAAVSLTALPAQTQQAAAPSRGGMLRGVVVDATTQQPLSAAYVRVRELGRNELSHGDGTFHFARLSPGSYTVVAERLGFAPAERTVRVTAGDTVHVRLEVMPSAISLAGVVVTGTSRERGAQDVYRPTAVLSDAELRRELGASVAATLAHQPGISQRYNGPAAAQPVIRGLGGDRVLMLEDGARTGDIASMSADHAVTIEPLTAKRIEVVRGPAGLLYGSNALGGVVNVIREEVPRTLPERVTGMVSAQGESVNMGGTVGGSAVVPLGGFALRGELSGRAAGDTRTPLGVLPSTDLQGFNGGLGASRIFDRGFAGAAVRHYGLSYGVPGEFRGDTIPGAHAGGVQIDLQRTSARIEAGLHSGVGPFSSLELDANYTRFQQDEIEAGGVIGSQFGQLLGTGNVIARHLHEGDGLRIEGALGLWLFGKDLNTAGAYTGSRPAREFAVAGYVYEELGFAPFRLEVGGRYDWTRINPLTTNPILVGNRQIPVESRDFGSFSGSVAALFDPGDGWTMGVSVARAFRTPSIAELYSEGPHLADFSYDVGNPELDLEYGLGADLFVRLALPQASAEASIFRNRIDSYIHYVPTGELDPRLRRFPLYQATQDDALLYGAEGRLQWEMLRGFVVDGTASYVLGKRVEDDEPLPAIPPLNGGVRLRYDGPRFFVSSGWEGAGAQNRVVPPLPSAVAGGEPVVRERPTPGYGLVNLGGGVRWASWDRLHTLTLQVNNVGDRVWYDHLSRIRAVAPQPGRNVQLLYRLTF